jgi:hypothetical protein
VVDVVFGPDIACPSRRRINASKDLKLGCDIYVNPLPTVSNVSWYVDDNFVQRQKKEMMTSIPGGIHVEMALGENVAIRWIPGSGGSRLVRCGVSKGVEDGRRPPAVRAGHRKAVLGVARPQGVEGLGVAGPGKTLGSPWRPLTIWAWVDR